MRHLMLVAGTRNEDVLNERYTIHIPCLFHWLVSRELHLLPITVSNERALPHTDNCADARGRHIDSLMHTAPIDHRRAIVYTPN